MTDSKATRAALEDAIRAHLATYPNSQGVLTDWMVIAAQEHVDGAGRYTSTVAVALPSDTFPIHRILGLLDHASVTYRSMLASWRPETE